MQLSLRARKDSTLSSCDFDHPKTLRVTLIYIMALMAISQAFATLALVNASAHSIEAPMQNNAVQYAEMNWLSNEVLKIKELTQSLKIDQKYSFDLT